MLVSRGPKRQHRATVTFRVCYYLQPGKPEYVKLGRYPDGQYVYPYKDDSGKDIVIHCDDLTKVRAAASDIRNRAKLLGIDPRRPVASDVFADVVKDFIELYAKPNNRSWKETERIFNTYVLPEWGNKKIGDIKRKKHIMVLLDQIAAKKLTGTGANKGRKLGGIVTADAVLTQLAVLFNWHATRDENFASPLVKKMGGRAKPIKVRARKRNLSDAELRVMWPILGELGVYGAAVKCMLLTAQRARKVAVMRRADVKDYLVIPSHQKGDDIIPEQRIANAWDPTREDDPENKKVSVVPLSRMARDIIDAVPVIDAVNGKDYVFSLDGRQPINSWSKNKMKLDELMREALMREALPEMLAWQLRDLRRTARTLLSRAGIQTEIAERCLGHASDPIQETYDRYEYVPEKREAFDKLAAWVERIVNPPEGSNVVAFPA